MSAGGNEARFVVLVEEIDPAFCRYCDNPRTPATHYVRVEAWWKWAAHTARHLVCEIHAEIIAADFRAALTAAKQGGNENTNPNAEAKP